MAEKKYIEREAAIENAISQMRVSKSELCMRERLMNLPAADVRPVVRGKWKLATYSQKYGTAKERWYDQFLDGAFWYCDNCKERAAKRTRFCPNCGADMRSTPMSRASGREES